MFINFLSTLHLPRLLSRVLKVYSKIDAASLNVNIGDVNICGFVRKLAKLIAAENGVLRLANHMLK